MFSDKTGKFPIPSIRGNKYVLVMFVEDANSILAEPLKSRSEQDIVNTMVKLHTYLTDRGFNLKIQVWTTSAPAHSNDIIVPTKLLLS